MTAAAKTLRVIPQRRERRIDRDGKCRVSGRTDRTRGSHGAGQHEQFRRFRRHRVQLGRDARQRGGSIRVTLRGTTIPHRVTGHYGASRIVMLPASPGTGVIAGAAARAVLELAGVKDVLTKCYGSTSPKNLVKATLDGLLQLRTRSQVERLRGVRLGPAVEDKAPVVAAATAQVDAYVDTRSER